MKRFDGLLVETVVAQELTIQVRHGGDDAAIDDARLWLAEPAFDLIPPGRLGRR